MISTSEWKIKMIEDYIKAYNNFDIEGMVNNLHSGIHFKNISDDQVNVETIGVDAFHEQAEKVLPLFKKRTQTIREIKESGDQVEVYVDFEAIMTVDVPGAVKAGEVWAMSGKSIFRFCDGLIIELTDIS